MKSQVTVVACVSASGVHLPPMIIKDRKTLSSGLASIEIPETVYALSSKRMNGQFLISYVVQGKFFETCSNVRCHSLLLLLDGQKYH